MLLTTPKSKIIDVVCGAIQSIGNLGFRDFVIGTIFGNNAMSKSDIEAYVESYVSSQLDDTFYLLVQQMIHRNQVNEANPFIP